MIVSNGLNLRIGGRLMGAGAFNPASLFVGSDGLLLDMARMDTMSQDSAGATPVTAAGQPVGRVLDLSGRGRTASQAVSASRPTYRIDVGGMEYLEFDGVDDWLATSSFDWLTDEVTIVAAIRKRSDAAEGQVSGFGLFGDPAAFAMQAPGGDTANRFVAVSRGGITIFGVTTATQFSAPVSAVVSMQGKISSDINILRVNGGQVASATGDQGTATNYGTNAFVIGRRNVSFYAAMDLYGLIAINRVLTAAELAKAEKWAAGKIGVTLP